MTNAAGVKITDKSCLVMDEVDGMSAGDRGGVGALAALIRKTKVSLWLVFFPVLSSHSRRFLSFVLPMIVTLPNSSR